MASIADDPRCPRCGGPSRDGAPCPACLLDAALAAEPAEGEDGGDWLAGESPAAPPSARRFGRYELMEEIARGGMGVVYRARQSKPERVVALKVILPQQAAAAEMTGRFRAEAEMVAALDHPHLLPIYEAGEHDGLPFFSMKFAEGGSLARRAGEFSGDFRRIARLVAECAQAVHHAHQRGILHRDLKPGNILLDAEGTPYVTDFGIGKWLGRDSSLTLTNAALGTPGYAAPEQVDGRGRDVTTAADIHGLGAVLYELLTQQAPFAGATPLQVIRKVADEAPAAPRTINPAVPRDLETICLRCLAKEPTARFASAAALAGDLERWLEGRTILARPSTAAERLGRWMRRNPALAAVSALAALLVVAVAVGSTIAALRLQAAERQTQEQLRAALLAQASSARLTGRAGQRFGALAAIAKAASIRPGEDLRDEAVAALQLPDIQVERLWACKRSLYGPLAFDPTLQFYANEPEDGVLTVRRSADQGEVARYRPEGSPLQRMKWIGPWSASGRHLSVVYEGGTIRFFAVEENGAMKLEREFPEWDTTTARLRPSYIAWSPDERLFAMASPKDGASIRAADSGKEVLRVAPGAPAASVAFSPDGEQIAVVMRWAGEVHAYSVRDGAERMVFRGPMGVETIAWSPDGRWFAVASNRSAVLVFDAQSGELRHNLRILGGGGVTTLSFSRDSSMLASSGRDSSLRFWDPVTGEPLFFLQPQSAEPVLRFGPGDARVAISPFTEEAGIARLAPRDVLRRISHRVSGDPLTEFGSCDVSPDGRLIATASFNMVRLCDLRHGREIVSFPLDQDARKTVQFDAEGRWLYVCSQRSGLSRRALSWRGANELEVGPAEILDATPGWLLTSPRVPHSSLRAFAMEGAKGFGLRDLGQPTAWVRQWDKPGVWQAEISADGRWVATAPDGALVKDEESMACRLWDAKTGELVRAFHPAKGGSIRFSPSGRWIYASGTGPSKIYAIDPWREVVALPLEGDYAAFSPDESLLAYADTENHIYLAALPAGKTLVKLDSTANRLFFGPDGKELIGVGGDGMVWRWDLRAMRRELKALGLDWDAPDFPPAPPDEGPITARLMSLIEP